MTEDLRLPESVRGIVTLTNGRKRPAERMTGLATGNFYYTYEIYPGKWRNATAQMGRSFVADEQ
jgi:hypothetical protein